MRSAIVVMGLASLVAAKPEDNARSLRGAAPQMIQMKGSGMILESRRLDRQWREDDKDTSERQEEAWRRAKKEDSSVLMSREYMGCYSDKQEDRVMGFKDSRMDMTTEICRAYCKEMNMGHMYYATQYGRECWCGMSDVFPDYDRYGPGICDYPCAGDDLELCGGHTAFDLYRFVDDDRSWPSATPQLMPEPTPSPVAPAQQPVKPSPLIVTQDYGEMASLLELHNAVRCMHGAESLSYSSEIASTAKSHAKFLANQSNCGSIFHSSGSGYGENLYICGTSDASYDCYNAEAAMKGLYDDEVDDGSVTGYGGHASQILWKETSSVGCAMEACITGEWRYNVLVCNYDPPGNVKDQFTAEVEQKSKSASQCGYVNHYN